VSEGYTLRRSPVPKGIEISRHLYYWLRNGQAGPIGSASIGRRELAEIVDTAISRESGRLSQGRSLGIRYRLGQHQYDSENRLVKAHKAYQDAVKSRDQSKMGKAFAELKEASEAYLGEAPVRQELERLAEEQRLEYPVEKGKYGYEGYQTRTKEREARMEALWPGWYKAHLAWQIYGITGGQPQWYRDIKAALATAASIALQVLPLAPAAKGVVSTSRVYLPAVFRPPVPAMAVPKVQTPAFVDTTRGPMRVTPEVQSKLMKFTRQVNKPYDADFVKKAIQAEAEGRLEEGFIRAPQPTPTQPSFLPFPREGNVPELVPIPKGLNIPLEWGLPKYRDPNTGAWLYRSDLIERAKALRVTPTVPPFKPIASPTPGHPEMPAWLMKYPPEMRNRFLNWAGRRIKAEKLLDPAETKTWERLIDQMIELEKQKPSSESGMGPRAPSFDWSQRSVPISAEAQRQATAYQPPRITRLPFGPWGGGGTAGGGTPYAGPAG
jgi:hypothetical protein